MSDLPEYAIWRGVLKRCSNETAENWQYYGGRGITVCESWANSFENFFRDMGKRPTVKHSIERRDNNGPYAPDNCYWATLQDQGRNRSNNVLISHAGETLILAEWARRLGISPRTLRDRLDNGWSHADAVTTPRLKKKRVRAAAGD